MNLIGTFTTIFVPEKVEENLINPSMESHLEHQTSQEPSLSTTSSCCCCCSDSARVFPFPFSPKTRVMQVANRHDGMEISEVGSMAERLRFIDIDWQEVEKRFDRLASSSKGPELVVKWSHFGYCVGMQQSTEFANVLLRALRRRTRKHCKTDITREELYSFWHRMADPCFDSRVKILFDMWDRNMDGRIDGLDIKQAILLSASTNKLSLTHEQAREYAASIMEVLDAEKRGYLEQHQVATLLRVCCLPKGSIAETYNSNGSMYEKPNMSRAEILFRSYWRRAWVILLWLIVCFSLFTWKFMQYRHRTAFEVMGYCLCTAKGAAETLKFNMALILLPVCRNTITWLRRNRMISSVIPFNDNINFHKVVAGGIVIGVILHGGTHLTCDFPRICGSDHSIFRQTIAAGFGYHQPSYLQILGTTEGATGIAMVVLMAIVFLLATKWPRRQSPSLPRSIRHVTGYNTFWYSHHLLILVYALLIVHSMFLFLTNNLIEKTTWMYIAFPVLLYSGERIFRVIRSEFHQAKVLKASIYPGKVLSLKLRKPEGFKHKSGMYIFIQCPRISTFQWHPFSLTSGPEEDHLSVHIRSLGDWSYQIYSLFQEAILSGVNKYPKVMIDGPYGAASQDHVKYDTIMLIGLGIGATPFISILKDVTKGLQNTCSDHADCRVCCSRRGPSKAYFYWVTREQSSFEWFRDSLTEISKASQRQPVIELHNFLSSVHQQGDARSAVLSSIQELYQAKNGIDIVSKTQVRTHFGRPNWFSIFSKQARRHRGEQVGVFYCGPSTLAGELKELCREFSTTTATRFIFHKENY